MHSMSYNLILADKAHSYTKKELKRSGNRVTTKVEASESRKAKDKVGRPHRWQVKDHMVSLTWRARLSRLSGLPFLFLKTARAH